MMGTHGRRRWMWATLAVVALAGVAGLAGLAACESQSLGGQSVCGDDVATGGEECDGTDLDDTICADLGYSYQGSLQCSSDCTFDTSRCDDGGSCSNGILEFGELCDCGTDPANLPTGCTDFNGGPDANCGPTCVDIDLCGDGIVTGDEECDCGWSPDLQPADCSAMNGAPGGECGEGCQWSQGN